MASFNLAQFEKRMTVLAANVTKNSEHAVRAAAIAADQTVVMATPVDTGRARANWHVSIGNPALYNDPNDFNYSQAIAQGIGTINAWKVGAGPIFIGNNLPYIVPLENGWSAQAPAGMTKFAIQAAQAELKKHSLLARRL